MLRRPEIGAAGITAMETVTAAGEAAGIWANDAKIRNRQDRRFAPVLSVHERAALYLLNACTSRSASAGVTVSFGPSRPC